MSAEEPRTRFDAEDCIGRALRLDYVCCLKSRNPCEYRSEPAGTESVILDFYDSEDRFVFSVHFYLRPSGEIGATGLLDLKSLIGLDGVDDYV